jgi:hypothetical protein
LLIFPNCLVSRRLTFCFLHSGRSVLRAATAVFGHHINHQGCFYRLTQTSWRTSGHSVLSRWIPLVKSGTGKKASPSIIPQNSLKSSSS